MRCFSCDSLSFQPICKECEDKFLVLDTTKREVGNLKVVSFFDYYLIVDMVKSKYISSGHRLYKYFAKKYFASFIKAYVENLDNKKIFLIAVDENISRGYSNVALLSHFGAKGAGIKALHNKLIAKNRVKYAGKPLEYRLKNPRDFIYTGPENIDAILIDDTTTTGTTLEQAHTVLKQSGVDVHFALTLANAKEGIDY